MIQSASWTLLEQVRFGPQGIVSRDWTTYPILACDQTPEVEVRILDRPLEPAMGAGEAAQGPAAAAIANAWYRTSGQRIRDLPMLSQAPAARSASAPKSAMIV